ncbi:MAG: (2Fe-2S)-binding protein [Candidatus Delongbacteria bacterium]|nr:(2Fe-2S)-binding protein [Candidatus Delongbacteria bacterium]
MPEYSLTVNGKEKTVAVAADTPLLWVLRDELHLTGTKYSCGAGLCGSCTVHLNGEAVRSCVTTIAEADGGSISTIEGLAARKHPLLAAWLSEEVSQCGYCQPGQIMQAAALLAENPNPDDQAITAALTGNLCRCGSYLRIRKAIKLAAGQGGGR